MRGHTEAEADAGQVTKTEPEPEPEQEPEPAEPDNALQRPAVGGSGGGQQTRNEEIQATGKDAQTNTNNETRRLSVCGWVCLGEKMGTPAGCGTNAFIR